MLNSFTSISDSECLPAKYVFELVDAETGQTAAGGKGLLIAAKNGTDTVSNLSYTKYKGYNGYEAVILKNEINYIVYHNETNYHYHSQTPHIITPHITTPHIILPLTIITPHHYYPSHYYPSQTPRFPERDSV